jgi:hypothetical protein
MDACSGDSCTFQSYLYLVAWYIGMVAYDVADFPDPRPDTTALAHQQ